MILFYNMFIYMNYIHNMNATHTYVYTTQLYTYIFTICARSTDARISQQHFWAPKKKQCLGFRLWTKLCIQLTSLWHQNGDGRHQTQHLGSIKHLWKTGSFFRINWWTRFLRRLGLCLGAKAKPTNFESKNSLTLLMIWQSWPNLGEF